MEINPWEAPEQRGAYPAPPGRWRRRWMRLYLGALGIFLGSILGSAVCAFVGLLFSFLNVWGWLYVVLIVIYILFSFGIVLGVLGAVISGIGWMLAPRDPAGRGE